MNDKHAKTLLLFGANSRNPSLWKEYDKLKESEWLSDDMLIRLQISNARQFFAFIERHSPYYRKVFKDHAFSASRFDNLEQLSQIPIITKPELIRSNASIHTEFAFKRTFLAETSGTSGSALEFRKDERWDSTTRAAMFRSYDWYGVKPWSRYGYLWGYNLSPKQAIKTRVLDFLQNRYRLFSYDEKSIESFARKLVSSDYLAGYSSMIYEVAKVISNQGLEKPDLKLIKGTSEMILDVYQNAAIEAFGRRIASEYGAAESGLIAFECPEGNMHINTENVIVEVDNDGDIYVTNLLSYSFPVIRYRLGDVVTLSDESCRCGRSHKIIKSIAGRRGSVILGIKSRYPALTFYYVFKNLALNKQLALNYKALQEEKGSVDIYIEDKRNSRHEFMIHQELEKYFDHDMEFNLHFVSTFNREKRKFQYFESNVN